MVELKYGKNKIRVDISEKATVSILEPLPALGLVSVRAALNSALSAPLGCRSLEEIIDIRRPRSVAIAIPDETRPAPLSEILPGLLSRIEAKLPEPLANRITLFIGGGLHPPANSGDIYRILPAEISEKYRIVAHDARTAPMCDYGITSRGTPVRINAEFAASDFKIVVDLVEPHQFIGFTGGSMGVVIGCAAPETIKKNNSLMLLENTHLGLLRGNPVRDDLTEAGEMVGIDFAVNFVLDADKRAVHLAAGSPPHVLECCAEVCAKVFGVGVAEKFDIVLASCGGYSNKFSPYQAQKGLNLAMQVLKPGGHIMLLVATRLGLGDDIYFDYVSQFPSPEEVMRDFKSNIFRMGAHEGFLLGCTIVNHDLVVFSGLDLGILRTCNLRAATPASVIHEWIADFHGTPHVGVIPNATTTFFYPKTYH